VVGKHRGKRCSVTGRDGLSKREICGEHARGLCQLLPGMLELAREDPLAGFQRLQQLCIGGLAVRTIGEQETGCLAGDHQHREQPDDPGAQRAKAGHA
jgi:hypothetical protein